MKLSVDNA